ncbi:MAG: DUF4179 domain-containing protein [Leeuwenhoekiella sp.]
MKNENLEEWFESQQGCWDINEPKSGHKERFLEKLSPPEKSKPVFVLSTWWRPLAVAASVALLVFISLGRMNSHQTQELATVSSEMQQTQNFFTLAIEKELYEMEEQRTPQTQKLIEDALVQINILESDYNKLTKDLVKSGEDKRVIHAMITNFQNRIDLLNHVIEEIESMKKLNNKDYENQIL